MRDIIKHYTEVMQKVYKKTAILKESEDADAGVESPMSSPRKMQFNFAAHSSFQSQDSLSLEQLSELNKGITKKSFEGRSRLGFSQIGSGLWTVESSTSSASGSLHKDWPNLARCMEYILERSTQSSDGSFNQEFSKSLVSNDGLFQRLNDSNVTNAMRQTLRSKQGDNVCGN